MSQWIKLFDAKKTSMPLYVQVSSIDYLVSDIKGGNLCEVHLSTEVLRVNKSVESILKVVAGESLVEDF